MASQSSKIEEIIDTTQDGDEREDDAPSDDDNDQEHDDATPQDSGSTPQASSQSQSKKKKKKAKSKAAKALRALTGGGSQIPQELVDHVLDQVKEEGAAGSADVTEENVRQVLKEMKIVEAVQGKAGIGGFNKKDMGEHKFWATQPVPQPHEGPAAEDGYIEPSKPAEEVRQEAYPLPKDFEWTTVDIDDPNQIKEVYDLLSANYIEDDDASFRFQYTAEFLQWALMPPGYFREWHVGVRVKSNKKLVAFISGVPLKLRARKNVFLSSEINFLCVHKKLRTKRLAPVLIKEVTRQVHLKGVFQAIYTAGVVLPTPISVCRYFHRSLNVKKLIDIKFAYVPRGMTLARLISTSKVPSATAIPGLREMVDADIVQVADLFIRYMRRFDMVPIWSIEELRHQLLSGRGKGESKKGRREGQVTWSYVIEDPETHKITDFFSFYSLPSTIISPPGHGVLEAAYMYYYATDAAFQPGVEGAGAVALKGHANRADDKLRERLHALVGDALIVANNASFDVFNAVTIMDNMAFVNDLKFGEGNAYLNYYLYNWRTAPLAGLNAAEGRRPGHGIGVVML